MSISDLLEERTLYAEIVRYRNRTRSVFSLYKECCSYLRRKSSVGEITIDNQMFAIHWAAYTCAVAMHLKEEPLYTRLLMDHMKEPKIPGMLEKAMAAIRKLCLHNNLLVKAHTNALVLFRFRVILLCSSEYVATLEGKALAAQLMRTHLRTNPEDVVKKPKGNRGASTSKEEEKEEKQPDVNLDATDLVSAYMNADRIAEMTPKEVQDDCLRRANTNVESSLERLRNQAAWAFMIADELERRSSKAQPIEEVIPQGILEEARRWIDFHCYNASYVEAARSELDRGVIKDLAPLALDMMYVHSGYTKELKYIVPRNPVEHVAEVLPMEEYDAIDEEIREADRDPKGGTPRMRDLFLLRAWSVLFNRLSIEERERIQSKKTNARHHGHHHFAFDKYLLRWSELHKKNSYARIYARNKSEQSRTPPLIIDCGVHWLVRVMQPDGPQFSICGTAKDAIILWILSTRFGQTRAAFQEGLPCGTALPRPPWVVDFETFLEGGEPGDEEASTSSSDDEGSDRG